MQDTETGELRDYKFFTFNGEPKVMYIASGRGTGETYGDFFDMEMAHFVDCIINGTECKAKAEDGIIVMKILDAIYESARTGHEVIL